jgi:transcriptional/translational regulatory protein YebC/TACO1
MIEKAGGSLGGPGSVSYMMKLMPDGSAQVTVPMPLEKEADKERVLKLVALLEEHDDVEQVAHNMA